MSKWTPGPYTWREVDDWGRWVLVTDYGEERNLADGRAWDEDIELLEIEVTYTEASGGQGDDLFNKIKAGPDLYEAARQAYEFIRSEYGNAASQAMDGEVVSAEARPLWNALCAALAAAEGKQ